MSTTANPIPAITIDVTKDLESASDLQKLIAPDSNAVLKLASVLAQHAGQPVASAIGVSALNLVLTASPSWKTASGVSFSLKPDAKCTITIAKKGEAVAVALKVDAPDTTDIQLPAVNDMTYVNIGLDFDISSTASGSGTVAGLGISGKASGSATTTLAYCHPVPSDTETVTALKMALSRLVFPTASDSAVRMATGSSCRMNFDGTLNCELDVTYGLADWKLSAPSAALVQKSVAVAWQKLTLPAEIQAGATGSVKYTHTDHFGIVIEKPDAGTALLYLVRSAKNETDESVVIDVGINATKASVALDATQLSKTVEQVTGSAKLASSVATVVSQPVNNLETAATAKLKNQVSNPKADAGLSVALAQQEGRTALFHFKIDLAQAALAEQSWAALLDGNVADALSIGGFSLVAGSGVAEQLQRSSTIQFHFFNLFKWSDERDFFKDSYAELAADGTIRIFFDIGVESDVTTKKALDKMRFHFSATASKDTKADVSKAEIDLNIEISEKGNPAGALLLAEVLGMVNGATLQPTIAGMRTYAKKKPDGTLHLMAVLKPSAYGQLDFSPRPDGKPPRDQALDRTNWNVIHEATVNLMELDFVKPWKYSDWGRFNSYCNTGGPEALPDRRNSGLPAAVPSTFWGNYGQQAHSVQYFFLASAGGMNLFEDLVMLAKDAAGVTTEAEWNEMLQRVTSIVNGDANIDYAKPIAAAILSRATLEGAPVSVSTLQAKDSSTFTTAIIVGRAG